MVNYGNTKIYKIWSPLGDNIYIGCTTKKYLSQRMVQHKHNANKGSQKTNTSYIIFEEYGINNCFIELLEAKECVSKDECKMLEGKYIRELKANGSLSWMDSLVGNEQLRIVSKGTVRDIYVF